MLLGFARVYNHPSACCDQHAVIFSTALSKVNGIIDYFLACSLSRSRIQRSSAVSLGTQALHKAREVGALLEDSGDPRAYCFPPVD